MQSGYMVFFCVEGFFVVRVDAVVPKILFGENYSPRHSSRSNSPQHCLCRSVDKKKTSVEFYAMNSGRPTHPREKTVFAVNRLQT